MSKWFYPKQALTNISRNRQLYLPYLVSSVITIAMYYVVGAIHMNDDLMDLRGADYLKEMLALGLIVIGIFSCIFLLYTNSFLMKRRKKELGLYSVLGMEKHHICSVLFFESLYSFFVSIVGGIIFGLLFDKLVTLILCKLMKFEIQLGFHISFKSIIMTVIVFGVIFLVGMITNFARVGKSNPIELLKGENVGEKEPKTKIISAVLGVLFLGVGYAIAIVCKSPVEAIFMFFIAVICVIIGTYLLFMSGSIAVLKLLKKNKNYYYNKKHFNNISGMLYRMKQNSVGLANICILSTMVLVMISTTVSLYAGAENSLESRYPYDVIATMYGSDIDSENTDKMIESIKKSASDNNIKLNDFRQIQYMAIESSYSDNKFSIAPDSNLYTNVLCFMTADNYNTYTGDVATLGDNEVYICSKGVKTDDAFSVDGMDFKVKKRLDDFKDLSYYGTAIENVHYIIVKNDNVMSYLCDEFKGAVENGEDIFKYCINNDVSFNLDGTDAEKEQKYKVLYNDVSKDFENISAHYSVESRQTNKADFYGMYGSFLFLGIILGALFLIVTIMIIYYKQISEGYDDRERFRIMQQVGMTHIEVKKSIHSQVLTVFFLPLITACIHLAFSFPIISRLLTLLNLTNLTVFILGLVVTVVVFAFIYTIVYSVTAKSYYKIVS